MHTVFDIFVVCAMLLFMSNRVIFHSRKLTIVDGIKYR